MWRLRELINSKENKPQAFPVSDGASASDVWERELELERVNEGVSLDGVAVDETSIVSVTECGSCVRIASFWKC